MSAAESSKSPDIDAIMERIRSDVKASLSGEGTSYPKYVPPSSDGALDGRALIDFDELNYLNAHWHDWSVAEDISSHRRIVGPVIVRAKRFVMNVLWQYLLKGYLEREKQFQMQLVRYLNANARYTDARDYKIFWEVVKKMDNDVSALNERMDRLVDKLHSNLMALESDIDRKIGNG